MEATLHRAVRIYESPGEKRADIIGFSGGIADAARDQDLYEWLRYKGYQITPESIEQQQANLVVSGIEMRTTRYHEAKGIPIPDETVSSSHLLVEPPLTNEHLRELGKLLPDLDAIRAHRDVPHQLIMTRRGDEEQERVIARWSS